MKEGRVMADKVPKKKTAKKLSDPEDKAAKSKKTGKAASKKNVFIKSTIKVPVKQKAGKTLKIKDIAGLTTHKMTDETEKSKIEASKYSGTEEEKEQIEEIEKQPEIKALGSQPAVERQEKTIPDKYGDNKIVMMVRDPHWCYVYWDLSTDTMAARAKNINEHYDLILRVYDITDIKPEQFNGENSHKFVDIQVNGEAGNWYINVWEAGRDYIVDIGYKTQSGRFILLARSNAVLTPNDKVSTVTDEEWMVVDEDFEELFRLSAGSAGKFGGASESLGTPLTMNLSSDTVSSFSSPAGGGGNKRKFFLNADTEVIIYGATEKDASLTVKGERTQLKPDGTFSLRFNLPNGKMDLPVEAVSSDGVDKLTIRISVERKTE